jgi:1-acyl-sn-glycerol-3-phosphate acyltransferase
MKQVKNFLGHIYFVYALLLFACTMLIVVVPIWLTTLLPEPQRARVMHPIFRLWMSVFMPLVFCPVRRKGKHHFKKGEHYVVVINHNSLADIPVSSPWIPGPNKTLAKVEMARVPIFGVIYKAGSILVDRKNRNSRAESFSKMNEMLEKGVHLCLYPEGTRNKTDEPLQPFFDGAFISAIKAQRPVVPGLIFNTGKVLPHNKALWAWPRPIHIHFLEPVPTEGLTLNDTAGFKQRIYNLMFEYYTANRERLS